MDTEKYLILLGNLYEDDGDKNLYEQVKEMARLRGSIFVPVRLLINKQEHLKRLVRPERRSRWKSIDPGDIYDETPLLSINHPHLFKLDVSSLTAEQAANKIVDHINRIKS